MSRSKIGKTGIRLVNVNILAMRTCYSFTKCYHWGGTMSKRYTDLPVLFIATVYESTIISK